MNPNDVVFFALATPAFYIVLALGILLLAWGYFSKAELQERRRLLVTGASVLTLLAAAYMQIKIDDKRGFIADQDKRLDEKMREIALKKGKEEALKSQYMYMPTGDSLHYMTLGNPSIAADYVWLTSLQYVSNSFRRGEKFQMLTRFYRTMIDLDPKWVDAQVDGGKVISALFEVREKSEENFIYAIQHNPKSWKLMHEAGLLFINPPSDPRRMSEYARKASDYFDLTLKMPDLPKEMVPILNDRIARLRLESGTEFYKQAESLLWQNATNMESSPSLRNIARHDWLKAHSMAQAAALTEAAKEQQKRTGKFPDKIQAVTALMAKPEAFAKDAFGFPFDYNPQTGEASSHGANALRALQSGHIVKDLIDIFKTDKKQFPKDLEELRDFLRALKGPPIVPPAAPVIEAIGVELDPTVGPLGKWNYDPIKGEIKMPPECDAKALYAHIKDFFKD